MVIPTISSVIAHVVQAAVVADTETEVGTVSVSVVVVRTILPAIVWRAETTVTTIGSVTRAANLDICLVTAPRISVVVTVVSFATGESFASP